MKKFFVFLLNPFKLLISLILTIIISSLVIIISPFVKKGSIALIKLQKFWGILLLGIFRVKVIIYGLEKVEPDKGHIFISNHSSYLDIFLLGSKLPGKIAFLGKKELNSIPIFGWAWQLAGNIAIHRKSPKAFMRSLKKAATEVKNNRSVIIFPEGTRTRDGQLLNFKRGVTLVAIKSRAKVYPITINGAFQLCKSGSATIFPGSIEMIIHDPIIPDYSKDRKVVEDMILENARKKIENSYHNPHKT